MSETTPEETTEETPSLAEVAQKACDIELTFANTEKLAELLEAVGEEGYKNYIDSRYYRRLEGTDDIAAPLTDEEIADEARRDAEEAADAASEEAANSEPVGTEAPPQEPPAESPPVSP